MTPAYSSKNPHWNRKCLSFTGPPQRWSLAVQRFRPVIFQAFKQMSHLAFMFCLFFSNPSQSLYVSVLNSKPFHLFFCSIQSNDLLDRHRTVDVNKMVLPAVCFQVDILTCEHNIRTVSEAASGAYSTGKQYYSGNEIGNTYQRFI